MGLLGVARANTAVGVSPETFLLLSYMTCMFCAHMQGEGGLSRTHQYLRYIVAGMEELRSIKEYRTREYETRKHACFADPYPAHKLLEILAIVKQSNAAVKQIMLSRIAQRMPMLFQRGGCLRGG
jgi:hypothetical protein